MHIQRKIEIDRTVGAAVAIAINGIAHLAGRLLNRSHTLPASYRTIVVCKLIGMGSIIQATPLLRSIKENYPQCSVIFVSTDTNKNLIQRIASVDTILTIDDRNFFSLLGTTLLLLARLWMIRPDCYIDLEIYSHFSSLLTAYSCARLRFGFFKGRFGTRNGIYTHMVYFNIKAPISRAYLQIAAIAGCTTLCKEVEPPLPTEREIASMEQTCNRHGIASAAHSIVINPNASDLRIERRWSGANFAQLSRRLLAALPGVNILFIGSPAERAYVESIAAQVPGTSPSRVVNLAGRLSIGEMLALLKSVRLLITNDSGPLHCASALKTKVIALFGPCSPAQYGSLPGILPIYKNVYCSPCVHEFDTPPCNGDNACMKAISVDEVFHAAIGVLNDRAPSPFLPDITYRHSETQQPLGIVRRNR